MSSNFESYIVSYNVHSTGVVKVRWKDSFVPFHARAECLFDFFAIQLIEEYEVLNSCDCIVKKKASVQLVTCC